MINPPWLGVTIFSKEQMIPLYVAAWTILQLQPSLISLIYEKKKTQTSSLKTRITLDNLM